jgi:NAD(P)-dependent dehydrogenase (short-subunit alcohol dehydrogenase family)
MTQKMKTVLITGGNKGLGLEAAKQLAKLGYFVYLGSRDKKKGEEALRLLNDQGIVNVDHIELDVTDPNVINMARQVLEAKTKHLDVLINNAGITGDMPQQASDVTAENVRRVFETNFYGPLQVTQQFLPLLKRSAHPVIVNVSSDLGSLTLNSDPNYAYYGLKLLAYSGSKAALNAFTVMLATELKDTDFKVNSVNPGFTATDLNHHTGTQSVEQGAAVIVKYAMLDQDGPTGKFFSVDGETAW